MSYNLLLVRVPPGSSDEEVERIAVAANKTEVARPAAPPDAEVERQKRALVDALLEACPELEGGEPDYAALARANDISEDEARQRYHWWQVSSPDEGAGIEITLYDAFVDIDASRVGTDQDWEDLAKLINRIVDEAIAPPLAAAGFRRSGRTWRRRLDDSVIQVVNVEWSSRDRGLEGWFTLNAGVYFPALAEMIAEFPVTDSPKEYDCHLRKRPLPVGRGGWTVRVPGIAKPDPDVSGLLGGFFSWLDRRPRVPVAGTRGHAPRRARGTGAEWAWVLGGARQPAARRAGGGGADSPARVGEGDPGVRRDDPQVGSQTRPHRLTPRGGQSDFAPIGDERACAAAHG